MWPFILEHLRSLWPTIAPHELFFKVRDESVKNPFSKPSKKSETLYVEKPELCAKTNVHVLEGHCVQILRPEIVVNVYSIALTLRVMESFNVKAVKQRSLSHPLMPKALRGKVCPGDIGVVNLNQRRLRDDEFVNDLDFINYVFHVEYPSAYDKIRERIADVACLLNRISSTI